MEKLNSIDELLAKAGRGEVTIQETLQQLAEIVGVNVESLGNILQHIEEFYQLKQQMISTIIRIPEEVYLFERAQDLLEVAPSMRARFCTEAATAFSSLIFSPSSNAQPSNQPKWTKLKRLYIARIAASKLQQLLPEVCNLEKLGIIVLRFGSDDEKQIEIQLANLRSFNVRTLEGSGGKVKFMTPELAAFALQNKPAFAFSEAVELEFPAKLKILHVEEYEPSSMKQFENLESLACDRELPENVLTTFASLKRLQYGNSIVSGNSISPQEFSSQKKRILSILKEKKRLKRDDLAIVFYGVQLDDKRQLKKSKNFDQFLMNNFAKMTAEDRRCLLYTLNYKPQLSLPVDSLRFVNKLTITGAVDDSNKLHQFLASLENLVRLVTVDATLDSDFYNKLADVAKFSQLEIVHTDMPIDLCKMADFEFLLRFDDLLEFCTDLPLSLQTIEKLLSKFTEEMFILCKFNEQKGVSVRRTGERFALATKDEEDSFDNLQALIKALAMIDDESDDWVV